MVETYLAEHEADALADAGADAVEDALEGKVDGDVMLLVAAQYADGDAEQGDGHGQQGRPREGLPDHDPGEEGREHGGEGHEELSVAGADGEVTVEQAPVAKEITNHAGCQQPQPGLGAGIHGIGLAQGEPHEEGREEQGQGHPPYVHDEDAKMATAHLAGQCGHRPGEGYA